MVIPQHMSERIDTLIKELNAYNKEELSNIGNALGTRDFFFDVITNLEKGRVLFSDNRERPITIYTLEELIIVKMLVDIYALGGFHVAISKDGNN